MKNKQQYLIDKKEHRIALTKYHESLLSEIMIKWSEIELKELLNIKLEIMLLDCSRRVDSTLKKVLLILISNDSSAIDCLLCDLEDMPLFINDYEPVTRDIANYRLKYGK